jgi:hypothetical protein
MYFAKLNHPSFTKLHAGTALLVHSFEAQIPNLLHSHPLNKIPLLISFNHIEST